VPWLSLARKQGRVCKVSEPNKPFSIFAYACQCFCILCPWVCAVRYATDSSQRSELQVRLSAMLRCVCAGGSVLRCDQLGANTQAHHSWSQTHSAFVAVHPFSTICHSSPMILRSFGCPRSHLLRSFDCFRSHQIRVQETDISFELHVCVRPCALGTLERLCNECYASCRRSRDSKGRSMVMQKQKGDPVKPL
jgi:hypothetical protein